MVYAFGYRGSSWGAFSEYIKSTEAIAVDIRHAPYSNFNPFWSKKSLKRSLGSSYTHIPEFGNRAYKEKGQYDIVDIDAGIQKLKFYLDLDFDCVLICACEDYNTCHRRIISEQIKSQLEIKIEELCL